MCICCAFFGRFRLGDKQNGEIVYNTCDLSLLFCAVGYK